MKTADDYGSIGQIRGSSVICLVTPCVKRAYAVLFRIPPFTSQKAPPPTVLSCPLFLVCLDFLPPL